MSKPEPTEGSNASPTPFLRQVEGEESTTPIRRSNNCSSSTQRIDLNLRKSNLSKNYLLEEYQSRMSERLSKFK
jgi:hypothetical protein